MVYGKSFSYRFRVWLVYDLDRSHLSVQMLLNRVTKTGETNIGGREYMGKGLSEFGKICQSLSRKLDEQRTFD